MDTQADAAREPTPSGTLRDSASPPAAAADGAAAPSGRPPVKRAAAKQAARPPAGTADGTTAAASADGVVPARKAAARPAAASQAASSPSAAAPSGTVRPTAPPAAPPASAAPSRAPSSVAPKAGATSLGAASSGAASSSAPGAGAGAAAPAAAGAGKASAKAASKRPAGKRPQLPPLPGFPTAGDIAENRHVAPESEAISSLPGLLETSERLREEVSTLHLPLLVDDLDASRTDRERLLAQLDDYLLPRLRRMDAPLLAVIGGSTGAGKSTLTNSLVRKEVSRSGVLRPTTRSPVLVHHPYDSGAFLSQRILPNLARVTAEAPEPLQPIDVDAPRITALRLVPHEGVPAGIAIIDAPDIDSVVETNRELAVQLLAAADLWLFVTTAARYADAVPWEMLRTAVDRGASVAVILDRVPRDSLREVRMHLATMLRDRGLASSPMFTIPETKPVDGLLPPEVVAPLLGWLSRLAKDARSRDVIVRRTLAGALESLRERVHTVADAADRQRDAEAELRADLDRTFTEAGKELRAQVADGTILRGEVLARWQEFVGTGEFLRSLEAGMSRIRDRVSASLRGRSAPAEPLVVALLTGVQAIVRASTQAALEQAVLRWRRSPAGDRLLEGTPTTTLAPDFDARLAASIQDWYAEVERLVSTESRSRRLTARATSLGVDGTAAILMLVVFSHALAGDDGVASGTAALAQRILDAVFGDAAVRSLTARVHADLVERVETLLESERGRLGGILDAVGVRRDAGDRLRTAVAAVEEVR